MINLENSIVSIYASMFSLFHSLLSLNLGMNLIRHWIEYVKINELYFRLVKVSINNILGVRDNITISIEMFIGCYHMAQYCPCQRTSLILKLMILLVEFGNGANLLI
jgi:hypothetical protein